MVIFFRINREYNGELKGNIGGSRKQTEYEWSRLVARADLIAMNCQGWITGLLLSQLAWMFIPFDTQPELSLDNIIMVKTEHVRVCARARLYVRCGDAAINYRERGVDYRRRDQNAFCFGKYIISYKKINRKRVSWIFRKTFLHFEKCSSDSDNEKCTTTLCFIMKRLRNRSYVSIYFFRNEQFSVSYFPII